jgi:hypothetical protein
MQTHVTIDSNFYARCPKCAYKVAYSSGDGFISEPKSVLADTIIELQCPKHGGFRLPAGQLKGPA